MKNIVRILLKSCVGSGEERPELDHTCIQTSSRPPGPSPHKVHLGLILKKKPLQFFRSVVYCWS